LHYKDNPEFQQVALILLQGLQSLRGGEYEEALLASLSSLQLGHRTQNHVPLSSFHVSPTFIFEPS